MVYHGYENGFRTLGRQVLLEPIEWTRDGWFRALGGDLGRPMAIPAAGTRSASGYPLSDDFSSSRFGVQWAFHDPAADEMNRVKYSNGSLALAGKGTSPADSTPITCIVGDRGYEAEVHMELDGETEGGLLLFYNHKAFVGVGFSPEHIKTFQHAEEQNWMRQPNKARKVRIRVSNDDNVITYRYSFDEGLSWKLHGLRMEVAGLNHNVFGGFLSLRIGIYSAGKGRIHLSRFIYRGNNR